MMVAEIFKFIYNVGPVLFLLFWPNALWSAPMPPWWDRFEMALLWIICVEFFNRRAK
jgi:hypothetical protein